MRRTLKVVTFSFLCLGALACGNSLDCAIHGDNLEGRVTFPEAIPARGEKNIIVQTSTDSFSTSTNATSVSNLQGFITVPYSACVTTGTALSVRAFQDDNGNSTYDAGEGAGRDDGSSTGHGTYVSHTIPTANPSSVPVVEWTIERNVNIVIDSTAGQ